MKLILRMLAVLLCAALLLPLAPNVAKGVYSANDSAIAQISESGSKKDGASPKLVLSEIPVSLSVGSKITIKAEAENFKTDSIKWSSDNTDVATVDNKGVVSCVGVGHATITATATGAEPPVSASCVVNVTARRTFPHVFLSITYRYSSMGDYYYSDNNFAWQKPFGFMRLYDVASQLIGYQYDFKRVVFTYGNKDWLIELWKGQYALFQYGGEIGVYTKYSAGFGDTPVSTYRCASRDDWLNMDMILYQEQSDGTMRPVFEREYGKYWWCDGYRVGRLRKSKPATELRMVSRITLKDDNMANEFAKSIKTSGFKQVNSLNQLKDDCYFRDGCDVYFIWRNLTESQHLIPMFVDGDSFAYFKSLFDGLRISG